MSPTTFKPHIIHGYQSYPPSANCISIHPQPYYNQPSSIGLIPKLVEGGGKGDVDLEEADSDSESSSSSAEAKQTLES
ncbi:hypothetical protein SLEP1_g26727 [Rubroshorea leprosula]|uniref:Uncharacterized protein n=1 Tax=Rubroshorea leprosula TaxID=152421 RepID=A0AAV5K0H4_9ROSI|nr:hypothetical protein SLEP1_g26727 [Rubroshorea leprosula]